MRNEILSLMVENGLEDDCYVEMLDYTIDLFESQGLGTDYYGYHNINHELEVTYISLLANSQNKVKFTPEDIYLIKKTILKKIIVRQSLDKKRLQTIMENYWKFFDFSLMTESDFIYRFIKYLEFELRS